MVTACQCKIKLLKNCVGRMDSLAGRSLRRPHIHLTEAIPLLEARDGDFPHRLLMREAPQYRTMDVKPLERKNGRVPLVCRFNYGGRNLGLKYMKVCQD
jgi:hypothetical protein